MHASFVRYFKQDPEETWPFKGAYLTEHNVYKSVLCYSVNNVIMPVLAPSFCYIPRKFLETGTVLLG